MIGLQQIARAFGGEVCGTYVRAPGPGHSAKDRSMKVTPDSAAPDGVLVHSFSGDDDLRCKDFVRDKLGLGAFKANGSTSKPKARVQSTYDYTDAEGRLLFQVVRFETKGLPAAQARRQRRVDLVDR